MVPKLRIRRGRGYKVAPIKRAWLKGCTEQAGVVIEMRRLMGRGLEAAQIEEAGL